MIDKMQRGPYEQVYMTLPGIPQENYKSSELKMIQHLTENLTKCQNAIRSKTKKDTAFNQHTPKTVHIDNRKETILKYLQQCTTVLQYLVKASLYTLNKS